MEMMNVTIDGKVVQVAPGSSILDAAKAADIKIPTLCHMNIPEMHMNNQAASCRLCVVEVDGRRNLAPACTTPVMANMIIHTHSVRALNARRTVLELMLSDHPKDCLACAKSGECELQDLSEKFGIRQVKFKGVESKYKQDHSPSIIRDMDKCIMCRRCETMCNNVQEVGVLTGAYRGFNAVVVPAFEDHLEDSTCTFCGQCVAVCPVGALTEHDYTWDVVQALSDPTKTVVVQTAPAVRAALGEEFGLPVGTSVTGKMVAALRKIGFDRVFDTDFAADLTIMEEGTEFLDRLNRHLKGDTTVKLPILTSCCPAWVKFFEHQFPDMLDVPSTAKSPQQMFGAIAKTYFADKIGVKREDLVVVSIMPCVAKKYEAARDEFKVNGNPDVDFSLTTREIARLIKQFNINFTQLEDETFDSPLGESTGAGLIFGVTGGVIEAACRTAYELQTGETLASVDFTQLRGMDGVRKATINVGGLDLHIGIAHGLGNARALLERVRNGEEVFHAIEIMSCPGGCIGGGGQPYHHGNMEILKGRTKAIYTEDSGKGLRKSHENPDIKKLYDEFLGKPLGHKAHELLHTHYFKRKNI